MMTKIKSSTTSGGDSGEGQHSTSAGATATTTTTIVATSDPIDRYSKHNASSIPRSADGPPIHEWTPSEGNLQRRRGDVSSTRSRKFSTRTQGNFPKESIVLSDNSKHAEEKPSKFNVMLENLSQQKLKAWQPILKPSCVAAVFILAGVLFIGCGILLLLINQSVAQCEINYEDPDTACDNEALCTKVLTRVIAADACVGLTGDGVIQPPLFVYYRLTKYYQNHRRYVKSRNDAQLSGEIITNKAELGSCEPLLLEPDSNLILSPCGLIAASVFNDSYVFTTQSGDTISLDESAKTIAWEADIKKFNNPDPPPDPTIVKEWLSNTLFPGKVTNSHFIVWMRLAAMPDFRKLYARIDSEVKLPVTVTIGSRYPTAPYDGKKYVVLSQTSFLGGRNMFLGIAYEVLGSFCLLFGFILLIKNYQKPRLMGDVRHLNWIFNRGESK